MLNNNNNKKFLIIFSLLIAFVLLLPLEYSSAAAVAADTGDLTEQQITTQIARLQKLLTEKHIAATALTEKDLLATGGNLTTPVIAPLQYDALKNCNPDQHLPYVNGSEFQKWWRTYLTDFRCGHITKIFANNNTAVREFLLFADDNQGYGHYINISKDSPVDPVVFPAWTFNNTVPGPTMRMTQGDHVKITVINSANSKFAHSFHMHSIHAGIMDGVTGKGGAIPPGDRFTFDFIARPFGVYPYHCHVEPIAQHIQRGLYGMLIIDPPTPRPPAKEMVMMMNSFSFNQINLTNPTNNITGSDLAPPTAVQLRSPDDRENTLNPGGGEGANDNQFYAVNSKAFGYTGKDMIPLLVNRAYRIYLANMVEFDPVNSFHMHGNMFNVFPSGTSMIPDYLNDIVLLGQGDRTILEFKYLTPGDFMFHAHINRFTSLGWMGFFHLTKN